VGDLLVGFQSLILSIILLTNLPHPKTQTISHPANRHLIQLGINIVSLLVDLLIDPHRTNFW